MSGVFQNIDPPTPSPPGECVPPAFGAGGGNTRWVERGWGVKSSEDARHCSVIYICKYFVYLHDRLSVWTALCYSAILWLQQVSGECVQ
jgi:hypothetical protein